MTSRTPDMQALIERLDRLERQNRRLKRFGCLALLAIGTVVLTGEVASKNRIVEAETFVLKATNGKVVAKLDGTLSEPGLLFYDSHGAERVSLQVADFRASLTLYDKSEKQQAVLEGTDGDASLRLLDTKGNMRVSLIETQAGPYLTIADAAGKQVAFVDNSRLELSDSRGKVIWRAP